MPKVVVGVPIYNGERYIERSLAALVAQNHPDFGIIVSDNASTDSTPEILARFAATDPRVRIIRQPSNLGMVANFAAVLKAADCKYFAWRAHDDWSDQNWLRDMSALLDKNSDADLAVSRIAYHSAEDGSVRDAPIPEGLARDGFARVKLARQMAACWFYGLYRHDVLSDLFGRTRAIFPHPWSQDHAMLLPLVLAGRIVGTNDSVFHCHVHMGSTHQYRPSRWRDAWQHYADFIHASRVAVGGSGLPPGPALAFYLGMPRLAERYTEKLRRIARGRISEFMGGDGATRRVRQ